MSVVLPSYQIDSVITTKRNGKMIPKGLSVSAFQRMWDQGITGEGMIIAVIDTGIDDSGPDLKGQVLKHFNLTDTPQLTDPHGTHVAGTLCANGWLQGAAYGGKLLDIKTLTSAGGTIANVANGIALAVSNGAHVVNMSVGASGVSQNEINVLTRAIQNAWNAGVICVSASGNSGTSINTVDPYDYPASIEKVESVAACNVSDNLQDLSLAKFSNENDRVDLAALGVNIFSTVFNGQYAIYSGTSMATPHVSAMAALCIQLLKKNNPNIGGSTLCERVVQMLQENTVPVPGVTTKNVNTNQYLSALSGNIVKPSGTNISVGSGFMRYIPNDGPYVYPANTQYRQNGIYVGNNIA